MLTTKELKKLRAELPSGSFQKIADELGIHRNTVGGVLNGTTKYRQDIIDAGLKIIADEKLAIEAQKEKIKAL